jgi:serine/threonine protein phosphatase PrpC
LRAAEAVTDAIKGANRLIYEAMDARPELRDMGSTVVGLIASSTNAWLFNVGDSRGYLSSRAQLRLLSTDDTTDTSSLPTERTGLHQHTLTQCLGGMPFFEDIAPHVMPCTLTPGDRYLLCSDGLTDMLDAAAIERCLTADARTSVEKLLATALAEGGLDNVSIVLADILMPEPAGN